MAEVVTGLDPGVEYQFTLCGKEASEVAFECSPNVQKFRTRTGITASAVAGLGVNVSPYDVATDEPTRVPTGQALVDKLQQQEVRIARLTYVLDDDIALRANEGWKRVFDRLAAAGIDATITVQTRRTPEDCDCGLGSRGRPFIENPDKLFATVKVILDNIRAQHGGAFPTNFVGIDVNEPASNHGPTMVNLSRVLDLIKEYSDLPTFAGGWVGDHVDRGSGAGALCQDGTFVGDVYSPHIYTGTAGVTHVPPSLSPSTPAISIIAANAESVTSPTFSPPANSVVYAVVAADGAATGSPQVVNGVTSTTNDKARSLEWRILGTKEAPARSNTPIPGLLGGDVEVWWAYNLDAQRDIAVTAHLASPVPDSDDGGGILQTLVFENAAPDQAGAAVAVARTGSLVAPSATLTTKGKNSWVWGVANNLSTDTVGIPRSGQDLVASSKNGDTGRSWWTQRLLSGTAAAGTNVTVGVTNPSVHHNMVAFEVLALPGDGRDGPGEPEVDASTPAVKGFGNNLPRVVSPEFSPPAGTVLYAIVVANGPDTGTAQSVTEVTSEGEKLDWELLSDPSTGRTARSNVQSPGALGGTAEVWWAYNPSAQTNIQVTAQLAVPSTLATDGLLQVVVVKNAAIEQKGSPFTTTSSAAPALPSATLTASMPGTRVWSATSTWANDIAGRPGPGQRIWKQSQNRTTRRAWWTQELIEPISWSPQAGTNVTMNSSTPAAAYNMVAFGVKPGPVTDPAVFEEATYRYLENAATALKNEGCDELPPMFVSEYGAQSGIRPLQGPGSPQHQQAVIRGTYDALIAKRDTYNIIGASIWATTPPNHPYPGVPRLTLASSPWTMINHLDYRLSNTSPCPGCTVEGGATYVPAFFDLHALNWDD